MDFHTIKALLEETDPAVLQNLFDRADETRRACVGDDVYFRGLIEISNHCKRCCAYCGISTANKNVPRYRMTADEVLEQARLIAKNGVGTTVIQAGEDAAHTTEFVAELVRRIRGETGLAITLSLGERPLSDYDEWKKAGADRYLLRFETSDLNLYQKIHPHASGLVHERTLILRHLKSLGYETGSGVMVGIPGQTYDVLAEDLVLFAELELDMIGVGPYIPHPATPLYAEWAGETFKRPAQVPNDETTTLKAVAITRLLLPYSNIPSVTALATIDRAEGRANALKAGANIVMPNFTPLKYRKLYEIYPDKACVNEEAETCLPCLEAQIKSVGRTIGKGPGISLTFQKSRGTDISANLGRP